MENQHRQIKGYRELTAADIDLMNDIKQKGIELDNLAQRVTAHISRQTVEALNAPVPAGAKESDETQRIDAAQPHRWAAIARTDFQTGLMALTRAVAQPTTF